MSSYVLLGYRRTLTANDIFCLPEEYKSCEAVKNFDKNWRAEMELYHLRKEKNSLGSLNNLHQKFGEETRLITKSDSQKISNPSLFKILVKTYGPSLFTSSLVRLTADSLQFLLPTLTN